jgi:NADPH:quinone reductase-like Zn-dependent oxidoreductase
VKAITFRQAGEPRAVLALEDMPEPSPREGEVVIAVEARPINPADVFFVRGRYRIRPALPQIAGLEGAGRVIAGSAALVGKRVAFRWPGAWAERVAVPEARVHLVPDAVDIERAAQFSLNPITAWALLDEIGAREGDWIALTAAGSSVSRIITALARERGLGVIGIVRGEDQLGGGVVTIRESGRLEETIRETTGGKGPSAVLDSVGGPVLERLLSLLAPGATLVAYGTASDAPISVRNSTIVYSNLTWKGFGIDYWLSRASSEKRARMVSEIWTRIERGTLELAIDSRFALADFAAALDRAIDGAPRGKVIVTTS